MSVSIYHRIHSEHGTVDLHIELWGPGWKTHSLLYIMVPKASIQWASPDMALSVTKLLSVYQHESSSFHTSRQSDPWRSWVSLLPFSCSVHSSENPGAPYSLVTKERNLYSEASQILLQDADGHSYHAYIMFILSCLEWRCVLLLVTIEQTLHAKCLMNIYCMKWMVAERDYIMLQSGI